MTDTPDPRPATCGKPHMRTPAMTTEPGARPVGETLSETVLWTVRRREELEEAVLEYGSVCCTRASTGHDTMIAMREVMTALDAYRDAVAAEARAALLAGAPEVWVGRDDEGAVVALDPASGTHEVLPDPFDSIGLADLPPGTVRRYALVPSEGGRDV